MKGLRRPSLAIRDFRVGEFGSRGTQLLSFGEMPRSGSLLRPRPRNDTASLLGRLHLRYQSSRRGCQTNSLTKSHFSMSLGVGGEWVGYLTTGTLVSTRTSQSSGEGSACCPRGSARAPAPSSPPAISARDKRAAPALTHHLTEATMRQARDQQGSSRLGQSASASCTRLLSFPERGFRGANHVEVQESGGMILRNFWRAWPN